MGPFPAAQPARSWLYYESGDFYFTRPRQGCAVGSGLFHKTLSQFNLDISGLLYIEKISDGSQGWVPGWVTRETESDHRRAKNFKQRYQFLKALAEMDMAE